MTNSPLICYTKISPNKTSPRNHKIDTITIHCVVGQCSVETLGEIFAPRSKNASSNYGIGPDGRIGMYVEEKDRSWCSSNRANDNRAITIEVASDTFHPYKVTDAAFESLIKLCVDICKRNDIKELKWKGDKSLIGQIDKQNMTVHRWFANKSCPGDYLYNRHGEIAEKVNKELNKIFDKPESAPTQPSQSFKIGEEIILKENAKYLSGSLVPDWIRNKTLYVRSIRADGNIIFSIQKSGAVTGVIAPDQIISETKPFNQLVKITATALNIRKGPGLNYPKVGVIRNQGVYTIVETKNGWGKLKSGAGWIMLKYTKEV